MNVPINLNAPVRANGFIKVNASIDKVWQTLTEIENWPNWQKNVTEAKLAGKLEEGISFNWKAGGLSFKSRIHTMKPTSMFGWTGTTIGISAIHNWRFEESSGITTVTVEESLEGLLPRIFRKYFQRNLDSGIEISLKELKSYSEKRSSQ